MTIIHLVSCKELVWIGATLRGINEFEEFSNSQGAKDAAEDASLEDVPTLNGEEAVSHFMVDPLFRATEISLEISFCWDVLLIDTFL